MDQSALWNRFKQYLMSDKGTGFSIDISRMLFKDDFFSKNETAIQTAFAQMKDLEAGGIANPDEKRMVGHYWLRRSELAPTAELRTEIETTLRSIKEFAKRVHGGQIAPERGEKFKHLLVVGIGGSALGPQFVSQALNAPNDPLDLYFFDNTDPDGMERVIAAIPNLAEALCVVISKSGGTKETRNGQLVAKEAWEKSGLSFARACVAVTGEGSELDKVAVSEGWLARFPMWDWVGGRTSVMSAVGLIPAALQGFDIDSFLRGAAEMDELTRRTTTKDNPAALLALMWLHAGAGRGEKAMVTLPYKDRLELFSKYLQQLLMESLGKEKDLNGKTVNQGISVYGNKGSTDQHAYVQQLRDGINNFFVVFIEVLKDVHAKSEGGLFTKGFSAGNLMVESEVTSGDYLSGFYQGTRRALFESGRESITITVRDASAHSIGMLIALFERAVGLYASLININAYHQPGVEAGKKAAGEVLKLQAQVLSHLKKGGGMQSAEEIASAMGTPQETEAVYKILRHLAANGRIALEAGATPLADRYSGGK